MLKYVNVNENWLFYGHFYLDTIQIYYHAKSGSQLKNRQSYGHFGFFILIIIIIMNIIINVICWFFIIIIVIIIML